MKIELSHDEISAVCRALLTRAQETARNALKCKVFGEENDAEFWQERAEEYRKAYETVEAQRGQAFKAYEQAAVGAGAGAEEEEVREMENKTTQRDMVVKVRVKGLKKLKKVCKKMKKANLLAGKLASFKTLLDFKV